MFISELDRLVKRGFLPEKTASILRDFFHDYKQAAEQSETQADDLFMTFLAIIKDLAASPFTFEPYHKAVRKPFDYWQFGLDFAKPLIAEGSKVFGTDVLDRLEKALKAGENAVLLANHQTEMDPQIIGSLLEKSHPELVERMIFVAGQKVITDPLAVPFSMGCNLLCIYSRRHIEHDNPEMKAKKQEHNRKTMHMMKSLLHEGGHLIYVAPSGGRDRKNALGKPEVAPFDPDSIEMFRLMALHSGKICHFIPLALMTYDMLPPPEMIEKEIGEKRQTQKSRAFLYFGDEVKLETEGNLPKLEKRAKIASIVWQKVKDYYHYLESQ